MLSLISKISKQLPKKILFGRLYTLKNTISPWKNACDQTRNFNSNYKWEFDLNNNDWNSARIISN